MKSKSKLAALILALPLMTGCWVRSVYPFYEASDVIVDESLPGAWLGQGQLKNCALGISLDAVSRSYTVEVRNAKDTHSENLCKASAETRGEPVEYKGQLIQIGEARFLDVIDLDRDNLDLLLKVDREKQSLALIPLDSDWMASAIDGKTVKLEGRLEVFGGEFGAGPPPEGRVTLVSSTSDLREFLRQHGNDKGAFSASSRMVFQKK